MFLLKVDIACFSCARTSLKFTMYMYYDCELSTAETQYGSNEE